MSCETQRLEEIGIVGYVDVLQSIVLETDLACKVESRDTGEIQQNVPKPEVVQSG